MMFSPIADRDPDVSSKLGRASGHRTDIDGLRAVAVLSVLAFHTGVPGFSGGFVGVDVFFVLSGFLICSILLREMGRGSFSLARFYERRCKRILPALIVVLLFCLAVGLAVLSPAEAAKLGGGVMATALSVSNVQFYLKGSYFDHGGVTNPLLMTWSLAVEEQFYLVFPLLLLFLFRRMRSFIGWVLLALCAGSLALSVWAEFRHPEFGFYLPFTRAWELGAGTLLALSLFEGRMPKLSAVVRHGVGAAGLAMILASVFLYSPATRFPGFEALPPVLGTVLILLAENGIANRLLSFRPLGWVGLISYSLYLWHWPLLSFATIVTSQPLSGIARFCLMAIAFCAAGLSYRLVESPFRGAKSARPGRLVAAYGVALLAMLLLGAGFRWTNGFAARAPQLARMEGSLDVNRAVECIHAADRGPLMSDRCTPAPSVAPAVALLGDSHAEAIEATLRAKLDAEGEKLVTITAFSCPPLKGVTRELSDAPEFGAACARFNAKALEIITERRDIDTVVLAGSWPMVASDHFVGAQADSSANLIAGIRAEIAALEAAGKHVVLVDDWPSLTFVPLQIAEARYLPARAKLARMLGDRPFGNDQGWVPRSETITSSGEAVRAALMALPQEDPGLRVVDSKDLMCVGGRCMYADGPNLLYTDNNHVSHFGAERILQDVGFRSQQAH